MKFSALRSYSWIPLILVAAVSVGISQSLVAQTPEAPAAGAPDELKTLLVVAGARYEKLLSDISFLGPYLGQPAAGQMADALLAQATLGKSNTAIDKTKPWGIIVQTDGMQPYYVACLPVANADDIVEIAKAHSIEVKDGENGTKELSIPNKPPVFLKAENGVTFLSISPASLAKLPANAMEILGTTVGEYDLTVSVAMKNIPPMYRQLAIGALQAGMQQNMNQLPNESDDQYATRQRLAEAQITQVTQFINEVDTLTVGWALDAAEKRTYLDFKYFFLPDSKLAKQMSARTQASSSFAGFYQPDAAGTAIVAVKADPKVIADDLAQIEAMLLNVRSEAAKEIAKKHQDPQEREALTAAANAMLDAIASTVKEGHVDGGAAVNASPDSLTFVAGVHVKEPGKIEEALKKIEEVAKSKPNFPGIKWNASTHAGVNFHTMTVPVPEDKEDARKMLGETLDLAIGIGPESVYVAIGKDNIAAVSKAIDASAAGSSKPLPPFQASLSLAPIMAVAATNDNSPNKEAIQAMAEKLNGEAKGRDHIRATGQFIPNGQQYRIEAEEGVLQAIGTAAMMKAQGRQARAN